MIRDKQGKTERLAVGHSESTSAEMGSVISVIASLAAAWIAAGSTGLLGHPLRRALTLSALGVVIFAQRPFPWRAKTGRVTVLATVGLAI